jgi:hypothetical protein
MESHTHWVLPARRSRFRPWMGCVGCVGLFFGCIAFGFWRLARSLDLSTGNPVDRFKQALGARPPAGVSDIRVAGSVALGGGIAWIRFVASDATATLDALKNNASGSIVVVDQPWRNCLPPLYQIYQFDQQKVGWQTIYTRNVMECYRFPIQGSAAGWFGEIFLDRANRVFYVHAEIL